ncbi:hypothetical protein JVT61DRAFT_2541 [Boletus reticuloceps]|uniref:Uncharacterized protein n=1 Tax=Boletus reticuloceps TaxID=495285 RepID=A0A8I2YR62_9AGAM|nr:hypothetical protein JVT61DRAFT_2541 [Boletus reticuloceps]
MIETQKEGTFLVVLLSPDWNNALTALSAEVLARTHNPRLSNLDDSSTWTAQPDHVELFSGTRHPATLLAEEALSPAGLDVVTPAKITLLSPSEGLPTPRSRHTTLVPEFRLACSRHATPAPENHPPMLRHGTAHAPCSKAVGFRQATSVSSEESLTSCDSSSDAASDSDTLSTLPDDSKIPKPQGEPGRPGRGGYTLESALDWNHNAYTITYRLIDEHLDTTKCASAQSPALIKVVCDKAMVAFPDLENYSNVWPVNDMIMMRLKYTSSRARRCEIKAAAGKGMRTRSSK